MNVVQVHRPTRSTVPVSPPEPELLAPPPAMNEDGGGQTPLQYMLPVVGAMSSVVMMVVLRNGQPLFLVVAALVFVVAIIAGVGFALTSKGRAARAERTARHLYLDYLEQTRRDLADRTRRATTAARAVHPDPTALSTLVSDPARVWERRRRDGDFLRVRVGTGPVPWFDLTVPPPDSPVHPHDAFLLAEARLVVDQAATVPHLPVAVDLAAAGVVAVIAPRAAGVAAVRSLVLQLAALHGPDDLILAASFDLTRAEDWAGLDLLPHVQDPNLFDGPVPARRVAPDLRSLSPLLGTTMTDRLQHAHAARRGGGVLRAPAHLVVIADDHGRHAATLPVETDVALRELGVTVIHLLSDRLDEPGDVDVRIVLDEHGAGTLTIAPGTTATIDQQVEVDLTSPAVFVATARGLAALRTGDVVTGDDEGDRTPEVRELLDLDPTAPADWQPRPPADFLRVPFAWDDQGNRVHLDLKESAQLGMGPHGIAVGATGSGKSEMLRTLVLSLALTHPPDDLSMILVDYKGGAAFAPFAALPHLAGLIDNLADDAQLTTRARASIAGEVVRRQRLLKDAGQLASIGDYRRARETRTDLPPLPHLLVVIDEFGELLTAEPEFSDLFLQIGRIGRSIGVHLLLSSQRIEGGKLRGLDTYLSYRLGLRTFSESESQVMLGTADAYHLPALPGYGYLKVDTSIYTRFRAGYVSGPAELGAVSTDERPRPALVGPYNGLRRPSATGMVTVTTVQARTDGPSLVDTLVARLRDERPPVRPVWLDPLPARLALGTVLDRRPDDLPDPVGLGAVVGLLDDPARQRQDPWYLDLSRAGGHVAVIGAPQTGRSTLLRTLAVSLALRRTPREVALYGMDLSGGGLTRLEGFPHVGGVATRAHRDRLIRLVEELAGMLAVREAVFRDHGIDSMPMLRARHRDGQVPELAAADVVVLVDGYGQLRTDFPELEDPFVAVLTRASSYGIHLVLGMTRWSDLRMGHQALVGTRIELRLNDPGESATDRKLSATITADTPGRALLDEHLFAQVALPVIDLVDDDQVADALSELAARTATAWSGPTAAPIRLLPTQVGVADLPDRFDEPDAVPFGLRQDTMGAALWDFAAEDQHLLVLGDSRCGKTTLLRTLAAGLVDRFTPDELAIAIIDVRGRLSGAVTGDHLAAHARTATQARGLATSIAAELEKRPGRDAATRAREPRIVVLVDDHDIVAAGGADPLEPLLPYLPSARDLHLHVVITRPVAGAARALYTAVLQTTRDTGASTLLMSGDRTEGQLAGRVYAERFASGRGRYVRRGAAPFVVQVAEPGEPDAAT